MNVQPSLRRWSALALLALAPTAGAQSQLWIRQIGSDTDDHGRGLAADGTGGVYMAGWTWGALAGPDPALPQAWLARHDSAGSTVWIQQFSLNADTAAGVVAFDGLDGVYVAGTATNPNDVNPEVPTWIRRYDGAGNVQWTRFINGGQPGNTDYPGAAASDGSGGVYVGGATENDLASTNAGRTDVWFARFDGAGNLQWIRQFGTAERDFLLGAEPDAAGGVYLCGQLGWNGGQVSDAWFARYDGAGNRLWQRRFTGGRISAEAVVADGSGGLYVVGSTTAPIGGQQPVGSDSFVARYDGLGNPLWVRLLESTLLSPGARGAASDGSGGVILTGTSRRNTGGLWHDDVWLARFDGAGNRLWLRQLQTDVDDEVSAAAPDGSGGVYLGGDTDGDLGGPNVGTSDAWLARYDGVLSARYCSPAASNSTGEAAAVSTTGSNAVAVNEFTLIANQLPPGETGYFLAGQAQGSTMPAASQGTLCLQGTIGRYQSDLIQGPTGSVQIDLTSIPVSPPTAVLPGDTWNFQCWYRDSNPGPTSNFTDAVSVMFE